MADPMFPDGEKPGVKIRTTIEGDNGKSQSSVLEAIQEGGYPVAADENSDHEEPFVPYDVILIHGIYGTSPDSWTRGSNTIWINKAFAGVSARMGRIMSYGYHTDLERGRSYSPYGIYQEAEALLESLQDFRTPEIKESRRPIYFFSHDIGGTIVKAALAMATDHEDKYADILHSTRAMCFFGYPHRYPSVNLLEEAVLRLLDQKHQLWSGSMIRYAKTLTRTIIKVNDAFLGTQMLTQAHFVNVVSNHLEPSQQIFPLSMSTMATPFERVIKMEKPNCGLILAGEDGFHPVNDIPYSDWLMGDLNNEQHVALRKLINQASPVLPYRHVDESWQHPGLIDLPERRGTVIVHMRCSSGAEAATENASYFLRQRSGTYHPLLYMNFGAYDVRFNSCEAMMRTFIARIICNRLQTQAMVATMDILKSYDALPRPALVTDAERLQNIGDVQMGIQIMGCFDECDDSSIWFLRELHKRLCRNEISNKLLITTTKGTPGDAKILSALSEFPQQHVRTINHEPEQPIPFPIDIEASRLMTELGECYGTDLHQNILSVLSSCAGDPDICGLVFEWLRSCKTQMPRITRLLDKALTPALLFAELLEDVAEAHRAWARILLSWLLVCYRPLKCDEFQRVSDTVWARVVGNEAPQLSWADILQSLHGLITSVYGEIKFRHPSTRTWLESRYSIVDESMWYDTDETERHEMVLQTCIEYIQGAAENTEDATLHLPYAIEFWPKHWQQVETSEKQIMDLFENDRVFEFWANSLVGLKNALLKPHPAHINPLPVAAHLGLTTVAEALLERYPDQAELLGQALIEACRAGHAAVIRLLMRSYSDGLDFGDENLHEAARVASDSGSKEALGEFVSGLSELPKIASVRDGTGYNKVEANYRSTESQEKNDQQANALDGALKGEQEAKDPKTEEHVPRPLGWLVTPMARAIMLGMDDVVSKLLQLGVDPDPPKGIIPCNDSFLYIAAANSEIGCAKLLIEAGANQAARGYLSLTPLHAAIGWASGETVEFLIDHGASVDDKDSENRRALDMAAVWGSFMALEVILHRTYDADRVDYPSDQYPVNQAAQYGHKKCLEILLRHGFNPNIVTSTGETALIAAIKASRDDICKILLDNKADPDLTPENSNPPLIQAISMGDFGMVKLLIEHGATVDKREAPPDEGWSRTPLTATADWSQPEIFQYLLEKGADPNARDSDDIPVIGAAISGGHTNMIKWLIDANTELNVSYFESKSTPLHEATAYPEMVRLLIQHGADINKVNSDSQTALNVAISENHLNTVQILLQESKTKPDLSTATIQRDLRMAVGSGYTGVVEALLEAGADVNNVNEDVETLMISAVKNNSSPDMVRKILEYNPDLELRDNKENTVLHHINPTTNLETIRLIVNAGGKLNVSNSKKETPLFPAIRAQLDDVFSYMLRKEPGLLNGSAALSKNSGTALHEACRVGTLSMVRSLIDHQMDVNSPFQDIGMNGTPLIAATLREDAASSGLPIEIIALLLVNGADPTIPAGLFRYPLISACLACPADTIKLLLNSNASQLSQDSMSRRPVHLSCYNSLEVLNLLELPDSDFSAPDVVGRVPLHYAVMRGDVELAQAVLERSNRAGVGINVKDDDGWTPLLWAARTSPIWEYESVDLDLVTEMISFLLTNGADINARGHGIDKDWTARDVAYYHQSDDIDNLLHQHSAASEEIPRARKRGSLQDSQGESFHMCDCCLLRNHGMHYKCSVCYDFSLCYKCHWSASKIHPDHSSFTPRGREWFEDSTLEQEKISEMDIDYGGEDGSMLLDHEEVLYEDFDSEMSDETSED